MIISRTPLRISFVGGGSDIPAFYKKSSGAVVTTAINKYIYIAVNRQFDGRVIVNYSKTEVVKKIEEIENNLVREALKLTNIKGGIHITSISDIPGEGTGMGSSSSYIVGLLHALYAYKGKHVSAEQLAQEACYIEMDVLKKPIGKQDQYIAAYGGFKYIEFYPEDSVNIDPIICLAKTKKKLEEKLLLFYTGITRSADTILSKQQKNIMENKNTRVSLQRMVEYAQEMRIALRQNRLTTFGKLLHKNWILKKNMADGVSSQKIDQWYETARDNGAIGGKLLGAGGGGFLLFYAPKGKHSTIIKALKGLKLEPIKFEQQGSRIIFVGD